MKLNDFLLPLYTVINIPRYRNSASIIDTPISTKI